MTTPKQVQELIEGAGGKVNTMGALPDGSGYATASYPLPKDHWLYAEHENVPPATLRDLAFTAEDIAEAARYAVRDATRNGKIIDFDPDALVQSMVRGMLGPRSVRAARALPESSPLHDWRPADELTVIPIETAQLERIRARAWMNTAGEYARNVDYWRAQCEKLEVLLAVHRARAILSTSERALACPDCGDEYLHHGAVTVRSRPQEDGPGVSTCIGPDGVATQAPIDEHSASWSGRRDELAVILQCETCESVSELRIVQHKGRTLLTAVVKGKGDDPCDGS